MSYWEGSVYGFLEVFYEDAHGGIVGGASRWWSALSDNFCSPDSVSGQAIFYIPSATFRPVDLNHAAGNF